MTMSQGSEDPQIEKFHSLLKQSRDMLQEAWSLLSTLDVVERHKAIKRIEKAISHTVKTEKMVPLPKPAEQDELETE